MHFHFLSEMKIKVSMRSSPHRATVHRTVALNCSNPPSIQKDQSKRIGLFVAFLNLMYISAKILKRLKVKILRVATVFLCFVV